VSDSAQAIVIVGNPVDGFTFYGPFLGVTEANNWADLESGNAHGVIGNEPWFVVVLNLP